MAKGLRSIACVYSGIAIFLGATGELLAQAEAKPWGNLCGIRIDGQLMAFDTSIRVFKPDWSGYTETSKNLQRPLYSRHGKKQEIATQLDDLRIGEVIEDGQSGTATVDVTLEAGADIAMAGAYFTIELPAADYAEGTVQVGTGKPAGLDPEGSEYARTSASGAHFVSAKRRLEVSWATPLEVIVRRNPRGDRVQFYAALISGPAKAGQTAHAVFAIKAGGEVDREPVLLTLDRSHPGRAFDGIGGNFRLQYPKSDPAVIQYALENLRVSWGRVELPWRSWDPEEDRDPLREARAGRVDERVQAAMNMARRLAQRRIPVIASVWFPPQWAVLGPVQRPGAISYEQVRQHQQQAPAMASVPRSDEPRGNPLNPAKMDRICESLAGYLVFLKEKYGVEAAMFSFNESDIGVNVRQTAEEHRALIRALGPRLAAKGLATKMLLGDVLGDLEWRGAHGFIQPAMSDPETHRYIGAIGFHSWRINSDQNLIGWADAAAKLGVPLLVTEGGPDSHAHMYPDIFVEPSFQLEEIDQYTRISALCQPRSVIQWQLTADYSVLSGGGAYGNDAPLATTMRFWSLKQLGSTPAGSFALPIAYDRPDLSVAAFGDIADGIYTVHVVNKGAAHPATLTGLPPTAREMRMWVTDMRRGMEERPRVKVEGDKAQFAVDATSFTTVMTLPAEP